MNQWKCVCAHALIFMKGARGQWSVSERRGGGNELGGWEKGLMGFMP